MKDHYLDLLSVTVALTTMGLMTGVTWSPFLKEEPELGTGVVFMIGLVGTVIAVALLAGQK